MDVVTYALLNKKITEVELASAAGLNFSFSEEDGVLTLELKNDQGTVIASGSVDLPTEEIVKTGYLDTNTNEIVLVLANEEETEIRISIGSLVTELQNEIDSKQDAIDSDHKLSADLVDDTSSTNKFVTASDKTTWSGKMDNPMTASQDLIVGGSSGTPTRLAKGSNLSLLGVNNSGSLSYTNTLPYLTTAPNADNTSGGVILVILDQDPAIKYDGYIYIITESVNNNEGGSN